MVNKLRRIKLFFRRIHIKLIKLHIHYLIFRMNININKKVQFDLLLEMYLKFKKHSPKIMKYLFYKTYNMKKYLDNIYKDTSFGSQNKYNYKVKKS